MIYHKSWSREPRFLNASKYVPEGWGFTVPRLERFKDLTELPPAASGINLYQCVKNMATSLPDRLSVLFSGGTDSTLALVACVRWKGPVRVLFGNHTFNHASPVLIEWLKNRGCTFQHITPETIKNYTDTHIVTGTHGDSILLGELVNRFDYDTIWSLTPEEVFIKLNGSESVGLSAMKVAKPMIDAMPVELNGPNLIWWIDFCCFWYWDSFYMSARSDFGKQGISHTHFFGSRDFQSWSIKDARDKVGSTYDTYKIKYQELIWELVGIVFDLPTKTVDITDVINPMNDNMNKVIAITDDWRFIRVDK
jgi:hypothetical protein